MTLYCFKKAIELDKGYADPLYGLGNVLYDMAVENEDNNLFKEAFEKYDRAAEIEPNDTDIFTNWEYAIEKYEELNREGQKLREVYNKVKATVSSDN